MGTPPPRTVEVHYDNRVISVTARLLARARFAGDAKRSRAIENITLTTDFVILRVMHLDPFKVQAVALMPIMNLSAYAYKLNVGDGAGPFLHVVAMQVVIEKEVDT